MNVSELPEYSQTLQQKQQVLQTGCVYVIERWIFVYAQVFCIYKEAQQKFISKKCNSCLNIFCKYGE